MGEEWRKASDGAVTLRIYPGGVAGDEDAMIRKMRVGQIQAAAITGIGLAYVEPSFYALHIPMMYESDEEFDSVRDRYAPALERMMEEKGFVVLNWGDAGWVHFFSKTPVVTPAEAKALKLFQWSGDTNLLQLYKETGFHPVPLSTNDLLPGLQTGMVNAYSSTPLVSLAFQWFALAPNMADLRYAPADRGHGDREADVGKVSAGFALEASRGVPPGRASASRRDPPPQPGRPRGDGRERAQGPQGAAGGPGAVAEDGGGHLSADPGEDHAGGGVRHGEAITTNDAGIGRGRVR